MRNPRMPAALRPGVARLTRAGMPKRRRRDLDDWRRRASRSNSTPPPHRIAWPSALPVRRDGEKDTAGLEGVVEKGFARSDGGRRRVENQRVGRGDFKLPRGPSSPARERGTSRRLVERETPAPAGSAQTLQPPGLPSPTRRCRATSPSGRGRIPLDLMQASLPDGPGQSRLALRATARGGPQARP